MADFKNEIFGTDETPTVEGVKILEQVESLEDEKKSMAARVQAMRALPFKWQDKTLAPFAIDREGDWLQYRTVLGYPSFDLLTAGEGLGLLNDALAIVWFCSHEPDVWVAEPMIKINAMVREWARENVLPSQNTEIIKLANQIYTRAHAVQAMARPNLDSDSEKK